jgi:hypothetical protein
LTTLAEELPKTPEELVETIAKHMYIKWEDIPTPERVKLREN